MKKNENLDTQQKIINGCVYIIIFAVVFGLSYFIASTLAGIGFQAQNIDSMIDAGLGLSMTASVLLYLSLYKKMSSRQIIESLGLGRKSLSFPMIGLGIFIFFIMLAFSLLFGALGAVTNTQVNTNVDLVLGGAPLWFYIFAAVIEPINEEILFRGFLVGRIGIILSALIFSSLHLGYNSTFEIEAIAALVFGLIAGYVFKNTKSLYPSIIAHILVNSLAAFAILA